MGWGGSARHGRGARRASAVGSTCRDRAVELVCGVVQAEHFAAVHGSASPLPTQRRPASALVPSFLRKWGGFPHGLVQTGAGASGRSRRPHQSSGPVRVSGIELLRVMGPGKRRGPALVSLGHDEGGHVSGRQRFARSAVEKAFSTRVSQGRPRAAHSCLGVRAGGRGSVALAGARSPGCAGHGFRANRALTIGNVTIWNSVAFAHV